MEDKFMGVLESFIGMGKNEKHPTSLTS